MRLNEFPSLIDVKQLPLSEEVITNSTAFTDDWIDPEIIGRNIFLREVAGYVTQHQLGSPFHFIVDGQQGIGKSFLIKSPLQFPCTITKDTLPPPYI